MNDDRSIEYHGALARIVFTPGRAIMQFYESFQPELEAERPVMVLTFVEPAFGENDLADYEYEDVQLVISPQRVEIAELYGHRMAMLPAKQIIVSHEAYDVEDLKVFLRRAAEQAERGWKDLTQARQTINDGTKLIVELLRRAEIKAAASDVLDEKQAAAIAVLKRLLVHFKG